MLTVRRHRHELTFGEVRELIQLHQKNQNRMTKLLEEYKGNNHEINNMERKADGKADNRISHSFPYLISSTICGFMNAKPNIRFEEQEIGEVINDVFKYNDADKQNTSLLLDMSIYGVGVEQFYIDKRGNIRFKRIDARDVIVVKDSSIEEETFLVIKHWKVEGIGEENEEYIELYYEHKVVRYYQNNKNEIHDMTEEALFFNDVPFNIYKNNEQELGDYERILPIVGAYNKYQSEILNGVQDITNALMLISGVTLSDEQLQQVKNLRVLVDENAIDAKMIYNDVQFNEAYLQNLRRDIFALSGCIDLTSSEVGNLSGSALKQRLVNLFYICSVKANYLKEGYLRRIELILNIHGLTHNVNIDEIIKNTEIEINYNTLEDSTEMLALVQGLDGIVSKETQLSLLGDKIVSVEDELEKLAKEREENMSMFSFMQDEQGHLLSEDEEEPLDGDTDEEETTEEV